MTRQTNSDLDAAMDDVTADDTFSAVSALEDDVDAAAQVLFDGDDGELTLAQRQCLHALLKHNYISSSRHEKQWQTLAHHEMLIKSRLNDLFLDLRIDVEREVAYKVQVREGAGGQFPVLLNRTSFNREETILLIFLRTKYHADTTAGETHVTVDREQLLNHVEGFRPAGSSDVAGDRRRTSHAIDHLKSAQFLMSTGDDDRFHVSAIIVSVLPLTRLKELRDWMIAENASQEEVSS